MNLNEKREFLAKVSIFSRCKRSDLKALAKSCQEMSFRKGDVICQQGDRGSALFIITTGEVDVIEEHKDGNITNLARLVEQAVIGELSIIDGETRSATVVAAMDTTCLVLTSWDLMATIQDRPLIAMDILNIVIARYRSLAEKMRELPLMQ